MAPGLMIALLVVPIAELWVILQVSDRVGVLSTIGLLILVSILGGWLLKQQGAATWRRLQATLRRGEMPTVEAIDGALILFGGALLLTPGFLTDLVGLALIFPPTRASLRGVFRRFGRRGAGRRWQVIESRSPTARVVKVEKSVRPRGSTPPGSSRLPPSSGDPAEDPGDDSRDSR
ncbi:MAG: FxsA family protein [Actinomycetota bacterium]